MIANPSQATSARPFIPEGAPLDALRTAASGCRGCALYRPATQVVFGAGPDTARVMLVGEQPGDEEDTSRRAVRRAGRAGPGIARSPTAGVDRTTVYVTNAVKHFTFRREGKRRIHERPRTSDMRACRPWLEAEIDRVKPAVIVCLGSTAAQSLLGPAVRIQRDRGRTFPSPWARGVLVSYHPSAVLRADDPAHVEEITGWLVEDLRAAVAQSATASV